MTVAPAFRRTLILGVAVAALLPLAPVAAQEAAGVSEDAEIIVSARRRDERLIDVPVAVAPGKMAFAFKALVMKGDAVPGEFGGNQLFERDLLLAGDWRSGGADGDIRHGTQPMALVRGRASQ